MKIIISNYDDLKNPFYAGGGAVAVHEIAKRLAKNHQVIVLTGNYKNAKDEEVDGVSYKRIGSGFFGAKLGQILFHLLIPFYTSTLKYDLWIESFTPPFSTSFTPIFTEKPVIAVSHLLSAEDMQRKYKLPFGLIERIGLKFYDNFLVLSKNDKEKILETNQHARVKLTKNGVDIPSLSNKKKKHILFIGRIEIDQKGLDILIDSFNSVVDKVGVKLVIAGSGEKSEEKKLEKLINQKNLQEHVVLAGRVKGKEKEELFQRAFVAVAPSRYETFSLSALESVSYGLPVVGFDIDGLSWLPKEASIKVKPFDKERFADAILKLIKNKNLRNKLGKNARKYSKNFNWDEIYQEYLQFIKKVVENNDLIGESKGKKRIIAKIIKEKPTCYFVSPHFDDAILSSGALISHLVEQSVPVKVVNVFTKAGDSPYTISAKVYLRKCGEKDAKVLYQKRREEDKKVFNKLGINPLNLGFTEALWRKRKNKIFSKFPIPELSHRYPTYRFHIKKGKIKSEDNDLKNKIKDKLRKLIKDDKFIVFCPKGVGRHVDHLIVRNACDEVFDNLVFWEDTPYCLREETNVKLNGKTLNSFLFSKQLNKKRNLIKGYKSQIKPEWADNNLSGISERYFYKKNLNI